MMRKAVKGSGPVCHWSRADVFLGLAVLAVVYYSQTSDRATPQPVAELEAPRLQLYAPTLIETQQSFEGPDSDWDFVQHAGGSPMRADSGAGSPSSELRDSKARVQGLELDAVNREKKYARKAASKKYAAEAVKRYSCSKGQGPEHGSVEELDKPSREACAKACLEQGSSCGTFDVSEHTWSGLGSKPCRLYTPGGTPRKGNGGSDNRVFCEPRHARQLNTEAPSLDTRTAAGVDVEEAHVAPAPADEGADGANLLPGADSTFEQEQGGHTMAWSGFCGSPAVVSDSAHGGKKSLFFEGKHREELYCGPHLSLGALGTLSCGVPYRVTAWVSTEAAWFKSHQVQKLGRVGHHTHFLLSVKSNGALEACGSSDADDYIWVAAKALEHASEGRWVKVEGVLQIGTDQTRGKVDKGALLIVEGVEKGASIYVDDVRVVPSGGAPQPKAQHDRAWRYPCTTGHGGSRVVGSPPEQIFGEGEARAPYSAPMNC